MIEFFLDQRKLVLDKGLPSSYRSLLLCGAQCYKTSGQWGAAVIQKIEYLRYSIYLNVYQCFEDKKLKIFYSRSGLLTTLALGNKFQQVMCGAGKSTLREFQYVSAFGEAMEKYILLKRKSEIITLEVHFSDDMIDESVRNNFSTTLHFLSDKKPYPVIIDEPYRVVDETQREMIGRFMKCKDEQAITDGLISDFLYSILNVSRRDHADFLNMSAYDIVKVKMAITLILSDLDKHYSIVEIADRVKCSPTTLKQGFRQLTGKGLYEFLMFHRCVRIRDELIYTDKPLKAIYQQSGYKDVPAFINGFKRHMGCSPTIFRTRGAVE